MRPCCIKCSTPIDDATGVVFTPYDDVSPKVMLCLRCLNAALWFNQIELEGDLPKVLIC